MTRIEKLTPEQEALLPVKRDEWIRHGLSTEPANRAEAERGVRLAYKAAGLEPPRFMIWADSPYAGAFAQAYTPHVIEAFAGCAGKRFEARVRAQVEDQVRDQVRAQVWDQVWAQVWAQVRAQVWAQVRDQVKKWHEACVYDYWTTYYSAWFDTMRQLGVKNLEPWEGMELVGKNAYWFWTFRGAAVLTERPREIHRDEQGRLHNPDGPAMVWPDGWGFHAWHGIRVPEWVITEPTVDRALKERNSEIRRAAFERIGWSDAIIELGLKPIATAADPGNAPHMLELYELPEQIYDEPVNLLLMVNGSPDRSGAIRRYGETVPANIKDPIAASAWQYQVDPNVYRTVERRS